MALDTEIDVPLAAVAALVRGAVIADIGEDALLKVFEDPRSLTIMGALSFPAMCVYRGSEKQRRAGSESLVDDITIMFDYVLPSTAVDKRGKRWPALKSVWRSLSRAVIAGHHASVEDDALVLDAAATQALDASGSVKYLVADGGSENYPFFRGQIVVVHDEADVDWTVLDAFKQFHFAFDGFENPDPATRTAEPLTFGLATLEGYTPP